MEERRLYKSNVLFSLLDPLHVAHVHGKRVHIQAVGNNTDFSFFAPHKSRTHEYLNCEWREQYQQTEIFYLIRLFEGVYFTHSHNGDVSTAAHNRREVRWSAKGR